ncbi:UNVERIFIED_CONTAM: hypothetical protein FKN15_065562 [Acipenser sinensis]
MDASMLDVMVDAWDQQRRRAEKERQDASDAQRQEERRQQYTIIRGEDEGDVQASVATAGKPHAAVSIAASRTALGCLFLTARECPFGTSQGCHAITCPAPPGLPVRHCLGLPIPHRPVMLIPHRPGMPVRHLPGMPRRHCPGRSVLQEVLDTDLSNEAFPFSTDKIVKAAGHEIYDQASLSLDEKCRRVTEHPVETPHTSRVLLKPSRNHKPKAHTHTFSVLAFAISMF